MSYSYIHEAHMSPALNGSSAIWRFKHSNVIEIHGGITFDFYMGLPHMEMIGILPRYNTTIIGRYFGRYMLQNVSYCQ